MENTKRLYRCSFDALLKWKGKDNERWADDHLDIHVTSDVGAIQAGRKAVKCARKKIGGQGFPRIKDVRLRSVVFVSVVDE